MQLLCREKNHVLDVAVSHFLLLLVKQRLSETRIFAGQSANAANGTLVLYTILSSVEKERSAVF